MKGKKKKNGSHTKDTTEQPLEANETVSSPDRRTGNTLDERDARIVVHEKAILSREKADLREEDAGLREDDADLREEAADLDEKVQRAGRKTEKEKAARRTITETLLREANEQLTIATIHAQTMTDAAEQATMQMTHLAEHDFLTGLPIRRLLADRLA